MAIKLVTEIMDWAPPLTHREHKVLIILAENARLSTRETWDSVESWHILHRARLTKREMYAVIAALVAKGCLEKPVWGGRNHRAKYRIAQLGPRPAGAAERQAMLYANRPVPDQDQHAGKPHPENHDQHADLQQTEKPRSACGKTTPRLPGTTGRGKAGLESADTRVRPETQSEARRGSGGTTPSPDGVQASNSVALASEHNGSEPHGPDDQQIPIGVLQSQATDRNAREGAP
jgi:hypothetical protein